MFKFTIRDLLWLTAFVAIGAFLWSERMAIQKQRAELQKDRAAWEGEKQALLRQRDADIENERRMANLRAREMAGEMLAPPSTGTRVIFNAGRGQPIAP